MRIEIETIPHDEQKYPTVGDWWFTDNNDFEGESLQIRVSDMDNWKYELLVAFHELAEVMLCKDRGISAKKVDDFDKKFEKARKKGNTDEPGFDSKAPYRKEHTFATGVEMLLAEQLNVDWKKYDKVINEL